jgi:hypothetical protein
MFDVHSFQCSGQVKLHIRFQYPQPAVPPPQPSKDSLAIRLLPPVAVPPSCTLPGSVYMLFSHSRLLGQTAVTVVQAAFPLQEHS